MKIKNLFILCFLVVCSLPVSAQTLYEVVSKKLDVMSQSTADAQVIGQKKEHDFVEVFGIVNGWAIIKYEEGTGFVDQHCIKPLEEDEEEDIDEDVLLGEEEEFSSWGSTPYTKFMIAGEGAFAYKGLYYIVLSEERKTVALVKTKKVKYRQSFYVIPDKVLNGQDVYTVTEIAPKAFMGNKYLKNVDLPESLEAINAFAFALCKQLDHINFPKRLKYVGDRAFLMCNISDIALPESIEELADMAFFNCKGKYVLKHTKMGKLYVPKSINRIGKMAFNSSLIKTAKYDIQSLPDWISFDVAKEIGIHEDSYEEYMRRKK